MFILFFKSNRPTFSCSFIGYLDSLIIGYMQQVVTGFYTKIVEPKVLILLPVFQVLLSYWPRPSFKIVLTLNAIDLGLYSVCSTYCGVEETNYHYGRPLCIA